MSISSLNQHAIAALLPLMPRANHVPGVDGQIRFRDLGSFDGREAARVTLRRFGGTASAYDVQSPQAQDIFFANGPVAPVLVVKFESADDANSALGFYNGLPEDMRGWRDESAPEPAEPRKALLERVTYAHFVDALRRNEVRLLLNNGGIDRYRERQPDRWAVPVYDFGGLIQPSMPDFLGDDLLDALLTEVPPDPQPPAAACVFLHRFMVSKEIDPSGQTLATVLLRVEGVNDAGEPNVTLAAQHQTEWFGHGKDRGGHWRIMEPKLLASEPELEAWHRRWAAESIAMLAGWREDIAFREVDKLGTTRLNAKRKLPSRASFSPTKVIHIADQRIQYIRNRQQSAAGRRGSHASPHEHKRTICEREVKYVRNGKEVRYFFKKAGQEITVKPRGPTNSREAGVIYNVVR